MKTLHKLSILIFLLNAPLICLRAEEEENKDPVFHVTPQEIRPFTYEEFDQELKMIETVEKISPTMAESYEAKNEIKEDDVSTALAAPMQNQAMEKKPRRTRSR